jgi:hypothetical protein
MRDEYLFSWLDMRIHQYIAHPVAGDIVGNSTRAHKYTGALTWGLVLRAAQEIHRLQAAKRRAA